MGRHVRLLAPDTLSIPENLTPVEGLALFIAELQAAGFSQAEVDRMVRTNPARLLEM